jgi:hypothetical protein
VFFLFLFELQKEDIERGMDRFRQGEQDVNYDNVQMDMSEVGKYVVRINFGWEGQRFKHNLMDFIVY